MIAMLVGWWTDFAAALQFLTRLPRLGAGGRSFDLARSGAMLPLVGALVGLAAGGVYWAAAALHVPVFAAAALALAVGAILTGGLHEDGLADTADGFGGGHTRARKLEIMDDSRIGTYGVLALVFVAAIKIGCLQSLSGLAGLRALVLAHALARGALPFLAYALPFAKTTGLAVDAGRPKTATLAVAAMIAVGIALAAQSASVAAAGMAATLIVALALGLVARAQIGGITGDVLGAAEQLAETAVLIVAAVLG